VDLHPAHATPTDSGRFDARDEVGQFSSRRQHQGVDILKCTAEVRFLLVSVALLMLLVVPVAAATFITDVVTDAAVGELPTTAGAVLLVEGAPPPLLFMALGTLLVVAMVGRRARRSAIVPLRDEADGPPR
jgi:hypothetical protein